MKLAKQEKTGLLCCVIASLFPGVIASGFMPEWDVLPFAGWVAVAMIGSGVGGLMATSLIFRGAAAGMLTGLGMFLGVCLYMYLRLHFFHTQSLFLLETVVGMAIGSAPGLLLFAFWARNPREQVRPRQIRSRP